MKTKMSVGEKQGQMDFRCTRKHQKHNLREPKCSLIKKSSSNLITIGFVRQAKNDPIWPFLNNGATASEHTRDLSKFPISIRTGNLNARKD